MKADIHPKYTETTIKCACGHEATVCSTVPDIHVEICSNCHPFYTGKQKLVDTAGRIDKFNRKFKKVLDQKKAAKEEASAEPVAKTAAEEPSNP